MENNKILISLAYILPFLTIILMTGGLLMAFILKRPDFAIRGLGIAVPAILSALLLIRLYKISPNFKDPIITFSINQKIMVLFFGLLSILSIITIIINSTRPWYYFILISILYILIFIQIFSKEVKVYVVLLETIIILISLTYGITLNYPLYFGGTDITDHLFLSEVTYLSGHIIPRDLAINYADFPLYHILVAESSYLLGVDLKASLFIILGLVYAVHIIFIYYLFQLIIDSKQLSLLIILLYSVSYTVVYYGAYTVTRTMAYLGFVIMLYLIYKRNNEMIYKILAILFSIFIILVHQVSIVQIVIIIFILLSCERFVDDKKYVNSRFLILLSVLFLVYWFFKADLFTQTLILGHTRPDDFAQAIIKPTVEAGNKWYFLANHIDSSVFTFFAIIGIGYTLWKQRPIYSSVFALFTAVTLVLYIPNPLQTLWQTMTLFRFDRFMLLVSPFMAFIMGIGIIAFYNYLIKGNASVRRGNIIIISIFAIFVFFSVISNSSDSKELSFGAKDSSRLYFTESELNGFNYVFDSVQFGSILYSDYYTENFFVQKKFSESEKLNIPYYNSFILSVDDISHTKGYEIIRESTFTSNGLYFGSESYNYLFSPTDKNKKQLSDSIDKNDKIYSNHDVDIYYSE